MRPFRRSTRRGSTLPALLFLAALLALAGGLKYRHHLLAQPCAWLPRLAAPDRHMVYPPRGGEWTFAVLGDTQFYPEVAGEVLGAMEQARPRFMFQVGDLVLRGGEEEFRRYLRSLGRNWRGTPFFAVPGSHDRSVDGVHWSTARFERWIGRRYQALTTGPWTFLLLDTSTGRLDGEQREWFAEELRRLGPHQRLIVLVHVPPVDPRPDVRRPHGMGWMCETQLLYLLAGYDVRLIVSGHVHDNLAATWRGLPLVLTSQDRRTWTGAEHPAHWVLFTVRGEEITWEWREVPFPGVGWEGPR